MRITTASQLQTSVNRLAEDIQRISSMVALVDAVMKIIRPLHYKAVASGKFVDPALENVVHFVNWHPDALQVYSENGYMRIDPAPVWAMRSGMAISLGELRAMLPKDHPGHLVYTNAERVGYFGGYVVPQRSFDNSIGLVTFVGQRDPISPVECLALRSLAYLVFEHAEALSGQERPTSLAMPPPGLTSKEALCLKYFVDGKSTAAIARLMNVSEATVRFHSANLRRKIGVTSRHELVAYAIANSLVPRNR